MAEIEGDVVAVELIVTDPELLSDPLTDAVALTDSLMLWLTDALLDGVSEEVAVKVLVDVDEPVRVSVEVFEPVRVIVTVLVCVPVCVEEAVAVPLAVNVGVFERVFVLVLVDVAVCVPVIDGDGVGMTGASQHPPLRGLEQTQSPIRPVLDPSSE